MATVFRALQIAKAAHAGQVDRSGKPYIEHVNRVRLGVWTSDEEIVAVLHDVVEDCPQWTLAKIRDEGFSETVVAAVDAMTKRAGETYDDFIERVAADPVARVVKRADLLDNLNLSRLPSVTTKDLDRAEKYLKALRRLM